MDSIIGLVPKEAGDIRVKYNRTHVALGTSGSNFAWFHPRKGGHIHFNVKVGGELRDQIIKKLEDKGIESGPNKKEEMKIVLTLNEFQEHHDSIREVILSSEQRSRR